MNYPSTSLTEKAYQIVEEMIVTQKLEPGKIFSENELSLTIQIGRTPLREALQLLAHEGLVRVMPRRGMMVTEINVLEHFSLLETLRVIDRLIAQRASQRAIPEQRDKLRHYARAMTEAAQIKNVDEFMRIKRACDHEIGMASQNKFAAKAAAPLHALCRRFWYSHQDMGDLMTSAKDFAKLLHAIAAGKAEDAITASDKILDNLEHFTRESSHLAIK